EQLAAVVFIQSGILLAPHIWIRRHAPWAAIRTVAHGPRRNALRLHGIRTDAQPIVEIEKHRRTLGRRDEQVFELSQSVRANRLLLVVGKQEPLRTLADKDVEVI